MFANSSNEAIAPESSLPGSPAWEELKREGISKIRVSPSCESQTSRFTHKNGLVLQRVQVYLRSAAGKQ